MEFEDADEMRRLCIERLGDAAGRQFASLAKRGFRLEPVGDAEPAGHCRIGGSALLEPGEEWPDYEGIPLSLYAVLDLDELAPWLGDQAPPVRGLLNFFLFDPNLPYEAHQHLKRDSPEACRVVLADPARAVETTAPERATSYPRRPVRAVEVTMLPDCWDVRDEDVEFDEHVHYGAESLILTEFEEMDGNSAEGHRAFGWPGLSHASSVMRREEPQVHLLQLAEDETWSWGEAATQYFTIPAEAYEKGDFTKAENTTRNC
ncbi:Uncharacterized protein YwqG [Saccharopolyspora shandongensis]|uniref:Uncharacterized protein YwqG n=1 Tax=Saccharopolyspora shandongensis TaxID=418495 RepID=A0A1H2YLN9_9PSEU|nr:DUF1963 domain-containing protein [Saccharopolyspora shandongensis]SDX06077.1 Uncharacterized protein YwqG [Saccharopolyspora shandongensis]